MTREETDLDEEPKVADRLGHLWLAGSYESCESRKSLIATSHEFS